MSLSSLLNLIARHESESAVAIQGVDSAYDVVVGKAFNAYRPAKPITTMTVAEVLIWQKEAIVQTKKQYHSKTGYSAAGRYQIIRKTLQSLDVNRNALFDKETQDVLCLMLLQRRGLDKWANGEMSNEAFADALSKEWASLPFNTGKSFYAGDSHGNRALVSRAEVINTLVNIRSSRG